MSDQLIPSTGSPFDSIRRVREDGSEYWSARDLMPLLGYDRWENFSASLGRAWHSVRNSEGHSAAQDHFRDTTKMVPLGSGAERAVFDQELTRFACYLVAMNGDPRKSEIAAAQTYFAVKTREAESRPGLDITQIGRRELAMAVLEAEDRADREAAGRAVAEATVLQLAPKAQSWDTLADTGADYSVREAGYILNRDPAISTGQKRLFALLREWQLIDRNDRPYANHASHVTLRPRFRTDVASGDRVPADPQVRVTVAGLSYLHKRLGGVEPLDFSEVAS